ncbi:TSUP family transporter [Catellatospora bangladeshensis]
MNLYLFAFAVITLAAFAQSVSGFGFSLVAVPLLAMGVGPQPAVVAATVVSMCMNGVTAYAHRRHVDVPAARRLLLSVLLGLPLGLLALRLLPDYALVAVIAVVTLGCTVIVWRGWRISPTGWALRGAGLLSGLLTTATATNGPPLVAALQAMRLEPRSFRATLALLFVTVSPIAVAGFVLTGLLTPLAAAMAGIGLPAAALGGWLGNRLFAGFDAGSFRKVVLSALVISSLAALANAATGLPDPPTRGVDREFVSKSGATPHLWTRNRDHGPPVGTQQRVGEGIGVSDLQVVRLVPWAEGDLALLRRINTPEMKRYVGGPETDEQVEARHRRYLALGTGQMFRVELVASGDAAGTIGHWEREWHGERVYETGWSVLPEFQGRGSRWPRRGR